MVKWFRKVIKAGPENNADLVVILDALDAYEEAYEEAREHLRVDGKKIEEMSANHASISEYHYAQLQELEALLQYMETRERRMATEKLKMFLEHYNRQLTDRVARDYADATDEVQMLRTVAQQVAHVRNLFLGITKGCEYLHYQLSNVVKMRQAGLEEATIAPNRY